MNEHLISWIGILVSGFVIWYLIRDIKKDTDNTHYANKEDK